HRHEGVAYGPREVRVHREPLARPVERAPEALQLRLDRVLGLALPGPDALDELLTAERLAVDAFLRELALDDHPGRDPGVVGPRHPEDAVAQHALPPGQHVLDRAPVGVPDVEAARDVRGRYDHDEARRAGGSDRLETALGLPDPVPALLEPGGREV